MINVSKLEHLTDKEFKERLFKLVIERIPVIQGHLDKIILKVRDYHLDQKYIFSLATLKVNKDLFDRLSKTITLH